MKASTLTAATIRLQATKKNHPALEKSESLMGEFLCWRVAGAE